MNIVFISRVAMNPYVHLLGAALEQAAPAIVCSYEQALNPALVARWRGKADVLHVHWAEVLYRSWSGPRSALRLAAMVAALIQARRAGMAIVYTAHNVQQHDSSASRLDALANEAMYRLADVVHVHDEEARREVMKHHRPRRIAVIPHGNYIGAYPDTCTRAEARQRLRIDDGEFVFLTLGQVRPYKGLDDLISAFRQLPGGSLRLLIAGNPHNPAYGNALARLAAADTRIRLDLTFVADTDIQYYMRAADICVLPYRSGTTSGAAILAFSFGRPLIAPDVFPFRPLMEGGSGILYSAQPDGLRQALAAAPHMDMAATSARALEVARALDWQGIARQHLSVYTQICASARDK